MNETSGKKRSIDERLDALTVNLELVSHANEAQDRRIEKLMVSIEKLVEVRNRASIDISALARIAEARGRRLENLDGGRR
jgi:hypothetical protein